MEVVNDSIYRLRYYARKTIQYKLWKQSLYKWDEYIFNRHRSTKKIDTWSQYIIDHSRGNTAVYNSGGMFFKSFLPDITVIEQNPCPVAVDGMVYLHGDPERFNNLFDTLIMVNPISVKYDHSLVHFFTVPGPCRAGMKPAILDWVRLGGKIFLSFSDWHFYYDRLRYTIEQVIDQQIEELKTIGVKCVYKQIDRSNVDVVNGNIKLVLVKEGKVE